MTLDLPSQANGPRCWYDGRVDLTLFLHRVKSGILDRCDPPGVGKKKIGLCLIWIHNVGYINSIPRSCFDSFSI